MRKTTLVISIKNNSLLLVRKIETWILPGGKPEPGETLEACLLRECAEELPGCQVSNLTPLGMWEGLTPHRSDTIQCFAYAGDITGEFKSSREISEVVWVPAGELDSYKLSEITRQLVTTLRFNGKLYD